jgi:imidazolonepropionase-like amidohydrolase
MKKVTYLILLCLSILFSCRNTDKSNERNGKIIHELNEREIPEGNKVIALVGATLVDGKGGKPVTNARVIIKNNRIEFAGRDDGPIPDDTQVVDVKGLTVLRGLIDAHFHNGYRKTLAPLFLTKGITSVRDPGAWIGFYDSVRMTGEAVPRLFLTGPHIDMYPPAHPGNAYLVRDAGEGRLAVEKFVAQGATAIKVYFRLPVGIIREICETAHANGIPVTAQLETTNARDAINAGLDGIEHISSFGTSLLPPREVEKYKQLVTADNDARNRGRYQAWEAIKMENNLVVDSLIQLQRGQC